jgi:S1-C subfamily serine protease
MTNSPRTDASDIRISDFARWAVACVAMAMSLCAWSQGEAPGPQDEVVVKLKLLSNSGLAMQATGFVVENGDLALTAASNVEDASAIVAVMADGMEFPAEVVRTSRESGVAILRIKGPAYAPARIAAEDPGRLSDVQVVGFDGVRSVLAKDSGVVIGTAKGQLEYTRRKRSIPGISGAPVFLSTGEVVGLHLGSRPSATTTVGFAVPASVLRAELVALRETLPTPAASPGSSSRKWSAYLQLKCGEAMRTEFRASVPVQPNEVVTRAEARFESVRNIEVLEAPTVRDLERGSAYVAFEIRAPPKPLFSECMNPGIAMLVVDFSVVAKPPPSPK